MTFWIDGDSFPREAKDVIIRASTRLGIRAVFVANRDLGHLEYSSPHDGEGQALVSQITVAKGDDTADLLIAGKAQPGDMVFTRDIVFAEKLIQAGIVVLNDRGTVFTAEFIRERLSIRDFMAGMRESGLAESRGRTYGKRELQDFAGCFDRELRRLLK